MLFWFSFYTFFFACLFLSLLCGQCHMARHNLRHGCLLFIDGCTTANQSHIYVSDDAKYYIYDDAKYGLQYSREPNQALPTAAVDGHLCRTMGAINGDTRQNTGTAGEKKSGE